MSDKAAYFLGACLVAASLALAGGAYYSTALYSEWNRYDIVMGADARAAYVIDKYGGFVSLVTPTQLKKLWHAP